MSERMHSNLVELEEELIKLKKAVEYIEGAKTIVTSAEKSVKLIETLLKEYTSMKETAKTLILKIDKIDFPSRLDKMDFTISSINQNISNTQARIESVERNIKDEVRSRSNDLNKIIEYSFKNMGELFKNQNKKITVIIFLNVIILLAIILIIVGHYLKII